MATRTDFRTSQWRGHQCRSKLGGRSWRWSASAARRVRSTRNAVVVVGAAPEWSCTVCLHERKRELLVIIEIAKDLAVRRAPVVAWSRWGMAALNAASTQGGCSFFSVPWDRLSGLHRLKVVFQLHCCRCRTLHQPTPESVLNMRQANQPFDNRQAYHLAYQ